MYNGLFPGDQSIIRLLREVLDMVKITRDRLTEIISDGKYTFRLLFCTLLFLIWISQAGFVVIFGY